MDVHKNIFNCHFHVVKSKRQCGKSVMLENILIRVACERPSTTSIYLSPTGEQGNKVFTELVKGLGGTPLLDGYNLARRTLLFFNGSQVLFKSAEQRDNLRGYTVDGVLLIDEAAYISDDVFYTVLPWCNVHQPPIIAVSTPRFKTGWFYEYFTDGENHANGVTSYDWSRYDTTEFLPSETLEIYKRKLPSQKFKTEYLGEFLELEGSVFGNFSSILNSKSEPDGNVFFGIDWGTGNGEDYTAISICDAKKNQLAIRYFNEKDATETIAEIIDLAKGYKPLKMQVEKNSIGSVYADLLKKELRKNQLQCALLLFNTTNDSKQRLVSNLQVGIQQQSISLCNDVELVTELSMYECKPSSTGKPTYNAAAGYHDDLIIATMLSFDCTEKLNSTYLFA